MANSIKNVCKQADDNSNNGRDDIISNNNANHIVYYNGHIIDGDIVIDKQDVDIDIDGNIVIDGEVIDDNVIERRVRISLASEEEQEYNSMTRLQKLKGHTILLLKAFIWLVVYEFNIGLICWFLYEDNENQACVIVLVCYILFYLILPCYLCCNGYKYLIVGGFKLKYRFHLTILLFRCLTIIYTVLEFQYLEVSCHSNVIVVPIIYWVTNYILFFSLFTERRI